MIQRNLENTIIKSLSSFPIVAIVGSRQVGKTTLAKFILNKVNKKSIYLDLELFSDLNKLSDPELYLKQFENDLVIIDEIQRKPELFPLLRALIDKKRVNGRFLILGSASPDLIKNASESLAGRIIYHVLDPFSVNEVSESSIDINKLWIRGGYPDSLLTSNDEESFIWCEAFIKTYLERDVPQFGIRVPAMQLRKFWMMISHSHGQLWNASQIALSLGISSPTVRHYLDILTETYVVRQLLPYHPNLKKRLIKSPKVYIKDSGILHNLLNIRNMDQLQSNPVLGNSWEGFVIEQICRMLPNGYNVYFYRTNAGAEIDLIIVNNRNKIIAVEIKYSLSPILTKGFWISFEDLNCEKGYVIYPGKEKYPISKNIFTLSINDISEIF